MARQYYKDSTTGQMKPLGVKVEDTLPIGTEVDYDGTDIPEGWVEVDDPNEYSTTEQVIGKWIDGKPIYRKVIQHHNDTSWGTAGMATNISISHNISNFENLVNWRMRSGTGQTLPRVDNGTNSVLSWIGITAVTNQDVVVRIVNDVWSPRDWYIILEYTKTSD